MSEVLSLAHADLLARVNLFARLDRVTIPADPQLALARESLQEDRADPARDRELALERDDLATCPTGAPWACWGSGASFPPTLLSPIGRKGGLPKASLSPPPMGGGVGEGVFRPRARAQLNAARPRVQATTAAGGTHADGRLHPKALGCSRQPRLPAC